MKRRAASSERGLTSTYAPFLSRLASQLRTLSGWRRWLAAFLAGLVTTAAFAPINLWAVLFLTVPAVIWLIDGTHGGPVRRGARAAAAIGWWFGFGQFLLGFYWIHNAFLVDAETYGWMVPFVVVLLPAGMALYGAATCALARVFWHTGPTRVLLFAAAWSAAEWLRGHVITGFPWNLTGYAWNAALPMLQSAAFVGIYGLSLLTLAVAGAVGVLGDAGFRQRRVWLPIALAVLVLAGMWGGGFARLAQGRVQPLPDVRLRIVQPDIDQRAKWDEAEVRNTLTRLIQLSSAPGANQVTHLIWPETAVPFYLDEVPEALRTLGALVPEKGALITGTLRRTHGHESAARGPVLFFNSLAVVAHNGRLLGMYDKAHLVPFGEYTPFQDLLTRLGVPKVISGPSGFSSGSGPQVLTAPGVPPFQPLICYEAIFPGVTAEGADRAQWLVNVTNDAWFGTSAGPYQHLAEARVRAIEQGLPLVRAANTGISAVIDPYGHIHSQIPLGQAGVIDSALPKALEPTLYNQFGNRLYLVLLLALTALGLASPRRR